MAASIPRVGHDQQELDRLSIGGQGHLDVGLSRVLGQDVRPAYLKPTEVQSGPLRLSPTKDNGRSRGSASQPPGHGPRQGQSRPCRITGAIRTHLVPSRCPLVQR